MLICRFKTQFFNRKFFVFHLGTIETKLLLCGWHAETWAWKDFSWEDVSNTVKGGKGKQTLSYFFSAKFLKN